MRPHAIATIACALLVAAAPSGAQCTTVILPLPGGTNGQVSALRRLSNGDILITGDFTTVFGVPANRIARWNGSSIAALGSGLDGFVLDVIELPNGDLVAGGSFLTSGGAPMPNVARWNGTAWSAFGAGPGGAVTCIAARPNGEIFAGVMNQTDRLLRWNGVAWTGFGFPQGAIPVPVQGLYTLPNGDLLISGLQLTASFDIMRWDGATLQGMPSPRGSASRFVTLRDGTLCAVGAFGGALILAWNGSTWVTAGAFAAFGSGSDLNDLPNGDRVLCGTFFGFFPNPAASGLVRQQNGAWSNFGAGVTGSVRTLLPLPSGEVLVGGAFTAVDGRPAQNLALLVPTCPATAPPVGTGCSGSAGLLTLSPSSLPYAGSTQRSRATGLPSNAFGIDILGYAPVALPLSTLLPQGLIGCDLLVRPDALALLPVNAGVVSTALVIPNAQSLVGAVLWQQVASVELSPSGGIAAIATTNALQLTIGSF